MATYNAHLVIDSIGSAAVTDAEIDALQTEISRLEDGYDWDDADGYRQIPSVIVRRPLRGEACGTYNVTRSNSLQILGYSVDYPERLRDLVAEAYARAFGV